MRRQVLSPVQRSSRSVLSVLSVAVAQPATAPIRVLIGYGYGNHDWRHTTECVQAILSDAGGCEVAVETAPRNDAPGHAAWRPAFADHDVVVQVSNSIRNGNRWPEGARNAYPGNTSGSRMSL